jgi:hypothetical protein
LASSPAASASSEDASVAATGAAFSSFTGSTTDESSVLAFSFSASASAALVSSSSLSFSYIRTQSRQNRSELDTVTSRSPDAPLSLARVPSLRAPS